jgi:hypothetical protein
VGRLVPEERELGEDDAERRRDQQLEPGVPEQHEADDGTGERGHQPAEQRQVEPSRAVVQAGGTNGLGQFREAARASRELGADGSRPLRTGR